MTRPQRTECLTGGLRRSCPRASSFLLDSRCMVVGFFPRPPLQPTRGEPSGERGGAPYVYVATGRFFAPGDRTTMAWVPFDLYIDPYVDARIDRFSRNAAKSIGWEAAASNERQRGYWKAFCLLQGQVAPRVTSEQGPTGGQRLVGCIDKSIEVCACAFEGTLFGWRRSLVSKGMFFGVSGCRSSIGFGHGRLLTCFMLALYFCRAHWLVDPCPTPTHTQQGVAPSGIR